MSKELKTAIIKWLLENENPWQRVNACTEAFREYIYNKSGNYLIGGEAVAEFIKAADTMDNLIDYVCRKNGLEIAEQETTPA